jgi:hypothetical protein
VCGLDVELRGIQKPVDETARALDVFCPEKLFLA